MTQTVEVLVLDLLEWLLSKERSYEETLGAWRTSCPRLPVWEEANNLGLIRVQTGSGKSCVSVTPTGSEFLHQLRPKQEPLRIERPNTSGLMSSHPLSNLG